MARHLNGRRPARGGADLHGSAHSQTERRENNSSIANRKVAVFGRLAELLGYLEIGSPILAVAPWGEIIGEFESRAAARAALHVFAEKVGLLAKPPQPLPPPPRRHSEDGIFG
jgi:hypothetical protein